MLFSIIPIYNPNIHIPYFGFHLPGCAGYSHERAELARAHCVQVEHGERGKGSQGLYRDYVGMLEN